MTLIEAIEQVLKKAKRPLAVAEIAHRVVSSGRWVTQGATPAASVGSKLYIDTGKLGSKFVKVGKGVFALKEYAGKGVKSLGKSSATTSVSVSKTHKFGYVYILTNPSLKGMVKIGKTSRPVNTRSKELYNTAIPTEFVEYASLRTSKYEEVEDLVHRILTKLTHKRVNENREFYKFKPYEALEILKDVARILDPGDAEFIVPGKGQDGMSRPVSAEPTKKQAQRKHGKAKSVDKIGVSWKTKTQLANLLAEHGGNPGSGGHLLLTLSGKRKCPVTSRWRPVLSSVGIKFDANDFVVDWTKAKNPLPWA